MKFEIVEQTDLSGRKTRIYSIILHGEEATLYEKFFQEYFNEFPSEITDLDERLIAIGNTTGLRDHHYKTNEGAPGDGIGAFFDNPDRKLRLYFIAFGKVAIVLGGGGPKEKEMRAFQESSKLTDENYLLRKIAVILTKAIREKRLTVTEDGLRSEDDFIFSDEN